MIVLVIGTGGREHALAWRLARDREVEVVHSAPGNPGMAQIGPCHPCRIDDHPAVVALATSLKADLVVVGPEAPLAAGLVDALNAAGLTTFGPTRAAAQVEASKAFAKDLMHAARIPTAQYAVFESFSEAKAFIQRHPAPLVIKADGLYAGKGVVVAATDEEAIETARAMLDEGAFGAAGARVVIEEFLRGDEVSIMGLCDGSRAYALAPSQDHKAIFDGNRGPNTGGMGAYSPVSFWPADLTAEVERTVLQPVIDHLAERGSPFVGALYAGLMLTDRGPRVLEFNARFGDPETQVVLPRLKGSLARLMVAAAGGDLTGELRGAGGMQWDERSCACVVMASPGYPGKYPTGIEIGNLEAAVAAGRAVPRSSQQQAPSVPRTATRRSGAAMPPPDLMIFHAGTAMINDKQLVTAGGRVLGVTALASGLNNAVAAAYRAVEAIDFPGAHWRRDIGARSIGR